MRWWFLVMYLSWNLLVWHPEDLLISQTLIVYCMSPEKGGTKMQCLGAALLSVQGVAPIICWNCCEKPPAPNWDTRSHSGQVVLSSLGQLTAPWRLALAKILKKVVMFTQIPAAHSISFVMCWFWNDPMQCLFLWGCPQHQAQLRSCSGFQWRELGAGHPQIPGWVSQTTNFSVFSSASPLTHTSPFLVLFLTSPQ